MLKNLIVAALLAATAAAASSQTAPPASPTAPAAAASPAKKELVNRVLEIQRTAIEGMGRAMAEQPAAMLMQQAGQVLQQRVAAERREIVGREIEADVRKYVDESVPLVRDRAIKLAPTTLGVAIEEKFSEDELKQLIAWFDSPVNKKYQQFGAEMQNSFNEKLVADVRPTIEPKLQALEQQVRTSISSAVTASAGASAPAAAGAPKRAPTPARAASR